MADRAVSRITFQPSNKHVNPYIEKLAEELSLKYDHKITKSDILNHWIDTGISSRNLRDACDSHFESKLSGELVNA